MHFLPYSQSGWLERQHCNSTLKQNLVRASHLWKTNENIAAPSIGLGKYTELPHPPLWLNTVKQFQQVLYVNKFQNSILKVSPESRHNFRSQALDETTRQQNVSVYLPGAAYS